MIDVVDALHEFLEDEHNVPVELGGAFDVSGALPVLLHCVGHLKLNARNFQLNWWQVILPSDRNKEV